MWQDMVNGAQNMIEYQFEYLRFQQSGKEVLAIFLLKKGIKRGRDMPMFLLNV